MRPHCSGSCSWSVSCVSVNVDGFTSPSANSAINRGQAFERLTSVSVKQQTTDTGRNHVDCLQHQPETDSLEVPSTIIYQLKRLHNLECDVRIVCSVGFNTLIVKECAQQRHIKQSIINMVNNAQSYTIYLITAFLATRFSICGLSSGYISKCCIMFRTR